MRQTASVAPKEEVAAHVGVRGCSMAAITDLGFAKALLDLLSAQWPERYGETAEALSQRLAREKKRKTDPAQERKKSIGKRRTNARA